MVRTNGRQTRLGEMVCLAAKATPDRLAATSFQGGEPSNQMTRLIPPDLDHVRRRVRDQLRVIARHPN